VSGTPPQRKLDKFELHELIGEGAMGVVWKAYDDVLRRWVALKLLNPSFGRTRDLRDRFQREARAAAALQHPHIVTVFDLGEADGQLYIAMELIEGRDLSDLIVTQAPLPLEYKLDLVIALLDGLSYAHERGVVHRDVKPSNVRITTDGLIKIMDFGIARLQADMSTGSGASIVGTPTYMAPEQITGGTITPATDVFAAGCLLYELLSGEKPFAAETVHGVFYQVLSLEPKPLRSLVPSLPVSVERAVHKAMAKAPGDRYQTAREFAGALRAIRHALSGGGDSPTEQIDRIRSRLARISLGFLRPASLRSRLTVLASLAIVVLILVYLAGSTPAVAPTDRSRDTLSALSSAPIPGLNPALGAPRDSAYAARNRALAAGALKNNVPSMLVAETMLLNADRAARGGDAVRASAGYAGVIAQYEAALRETNDEREEASVRIASATALIKTLRPGPATARAASTLARADSLFQSRDYGFASVAAGDAERASVAAGAVPPPVSRQPANTRAAIGLLVQDFSRAIESRQTANLRALYPTLTAADAASWAEFFRTVRSLEASYTIENLQVSGATAHGVVGAHYRYVPAKGGAPAESTQPLRMTFHKSSAGWRIAAIAMPH